MPFLAADGQRVGVPVSLFGGLMSLIGGDPAKAEGVLLAVGERMVPRRNIAISGCDLAGKLGCDRILPFLLVMSVPLDGDGADLLGRITSPKIDFGA
ncbi:MAG: hypothetical protein ACLSDM_08520 [Butyricicoccus sp.]